MLGELDRLCSTTAAQKPEIYLVCQIEEEEPDALDAFMADEVLPEVKAKAAEAIAAREEARLKLAQERAVRLRQAVSPS